VQPRVTKVDKVGKVLIVLDEVPVWAEPGEGVFDGRTE
jgi:hypothetical protein